jgi:hypothetical protein
MDALIAAIVGFVTGILGTFVAPWVNWGIEKRRLVREDRRKAIAQWRGSVHALWVPGENERFPSSADFHAMKAYLSDATISAVLALEISPSDQLRIEVQRSINEEIAAQERAWDLI